MLFAARVSTQGEQTLERRRPAPEADRDRDRGLINYLMRDRHGSPFEHNSMTFYVQAPIFVFREFMRHRIASYNEESGRYRELRPVFYVPGPRAQPGAGGQARRVRVPARKPTSRTSSSTRRRARRPTPPSRRTSGCSTAGVAREVARIVLPLKIYSSMYVTMNARVADELPVAAHEGRGHALPVVPAARDRDVRRADGSGWRELMPLTHAAFNANGRVAP